MQSSWRRVRLCPMPPPMTCVAEALAWARARLAGVADCEPLDAPLLLGYVLGLSRAALIAHPEHTLTSAQAGQFRDLVERRAAGTPIAYLIGTHPFYDLPQDLIVTPAVLIPRPETEHLIEAALGWAATRAAQGRPPRTLADIGTGSGAIAVTLAAHLPGARVWAVDLSAEALAVAGQNAARCGVAERVHLVQGDLFDPLRRAGIVCDLIAANLPYVPSAEVDALPLVAYEPRLALDGGADGLDLIRRLLADAPATLTADGLLLLEVRAGQGEVVSALAAQALPGAAISVLPDLAGHDRIVRILRQEV